MNEHDRRKRGRALFGLTCHEPIASNIISPRLGGEMIVILPMVEVEGKEYYSGVVSRRQ
jgi:hypothetical protein